jgi:ferredoxin
MMTDDIYRALARRLDQIPNGFPPTESGIELRLLARLFTPEEARLASLMRLTPEPPEAIADRAGLDRAEVRAALKQMVRRGLISAGRTEQGLGFRLMPFVFGIYEYQLPTMDEELAALFEQYYVESRGGAIVGASPSIHRVIAVDEAIDFSLEVFPYERASWLVENARSWCVQDCICRVQQELVGKGCDHPKDVCLAFSPIEGAFETNETSRAISKEEALAVLVRAREAGLVHTTGNYRDGRFYICNCCTCSCGILRAVAEFGLPAAVAHSEFRAVVDADLCAACEDCLDRCQFNALTVVDVCTVNRQRCVGCGQCVTVCSTGALSLVRRPEAEIAPFPRTNSEWMRQRAEQRGLSLDDLV